MAIGEEKNTCFHMFITSLSEIVYFYIQLTKFVHIITSFSKHWGKYCHMINRKYDFEQHLLELIEFQDCVWMMQPVGSATPICMCSKASFRLRAPVLWGTRLLERWSNMDHSLTVKSLKGLISGDLKLTFRFWLLCWTEKMTLFLPDSLLDPMLLGLL